MKSSDVFQCVQEAEGQDEGKSDYLATIGRFKKPKGKGLNRNAASYVPSVHGQSVAFEGDYEYRFVENVTESQRIVSSDLRSWPVTTYIAFSRFEDSVPSYNPNSGSFLRLCGAILLVFRNEAPQLHKFVVQQ